MVRTCAQRLRRKSAVDYRDQCSVPTLNRITHCRFHCGWLGSSWTTFPDLACFLPPFCKRHLHSLLVHLPSFHKIRSWTEGRSHNTHTLFGQIIQVPHTDATCTNYGARVWHWEHKSYPIGSVLCQELGHPHRSRIPHSFRDRRLVSSGPHLEGVCLVQSPGLECGLGVCSPSTGAAQRRR